MTDFYAVVLTQSMLPPPMDTARALAFAHQTPVLDQAVFAKRAWGILAERQTEQAADDLCQKLSQAGMACRVISEGKLPLLPLAEPMLRWEALAPERILLFGAAAIPHSTTTTQTVKEGPSAAQRIINTTVTISTGIPLRLGGKARVTEKTTTHTDRIFHFEMVLQHPSERRRIDADHFDYSCLKERKLYQTFGNFRLLIDDFLAVAPQALRNHGLRIFGEKKPLLEMEYTTLADFERELRWRLTLLSMD